MAIEYTIPYETASLYTYDTSNLEFVSGTFVTKRIPTTARNPVSVDAGATYPGPAATQSAKYESLTEMTVMMWLYPTWDFEASIRHRYFTIGTVSPQQVNVVLYGDIGSAFKIGFAGDRISHSPGSDYLTKNIWQHITATFKAGTSSSYFRNGILVDTGTAPASLPSDFYEGVVMIGTGPYSPGQDARSRFAELAIWDRCLSGSEIQAKITASTHNPGIPIDGDMLDYWRMDAGSGSTFYNAITDDFKLGENNGSSSWTGEIPIVGPNPTASEGAYKSGSFEVYTENGTAISGTFGYAGSIVTGFSAVETGSGNVFYQLSWDGIIWEYLSANTWVSASDLYDRNTAAEVSASGELFQTGRTVWIKAIIESDTTASVAGIDTVTFTTNSGSISGSIVETDYYLRNVIVTHLDGSPFLT